MATVQVYNKGSITFAGANKQSSINPRKEAGPDEPAHHDRQFTVKVEGQEALNRMDAEKQRQQVEKEPEIIGDFTIGKAILQKRSRQNSWQGHFRQGQARYSFSHEGKG